MLLNDSLQDLLSKGFSPGSWLDYFVRYQSLKISESFCINLARWWLVTSIHFIVHVAVISKCLADSHPHKPGSQLIDCISFDASAWVLEKVMGCRLVGSGKEWRNELFSTHAAKISGR